jgi:hypothetical protein
MGGGGSMIVNWVMKNVHVADTVGSLLHVGLARYVKSWYSCVGHKKETEYDVPNCTRVSWNREAAGEDIVGDGWGYFMLEGNH